MTAEIATLAAEELGASHLVPIHYTQRPLPPLLSCRTGVDRLRPPSGGQLHVGGPGQPIAIG
jgi:hypothetical protein